MIIKNVVLYTYEKYIKDLRKEIRDYLKIDSEW